jgi:hypothetical protein
MRRHRHLLACFIPSAIASLGIGIGCGCAPREPAAVQVVTDRPATAVADADYLDRVQISVDAFQAPPGEIRVLTTTRSALDAARSRGDGSDFDNGARPLFYIGSDADWDYYYLADHAFSLFWRVRREFNRQDERMELTGNSLAWREVKKRPGATSRPVDPATKPDAATTRP